MIIKCEAEIMKSEIKENVKNWNQKHNAERGTPRMQPAQPQKLTPIRKTYIWGTEDWMLSWFNEGLEDVPLLIKIIKAREALSVQVHPGNAFAEEKEHKSGKTEMWYVLDCEPGAYLYYGLKHKISEDEFRVSRTRPFSRSAGRCP